MTTTAKGRRLETPVAAASATQQVEELCRRLQAAREVEARAETALEEAQAEYTRECVTSDPGCPPLRDGLLAAEGAVAEARGLVAALEEEIRRLEPEVARERISELQGEIWRLAEAMEAEAKEAGRLEHEIETLQRQLREVDERRQQLALSKASQEREIQELRAQIWETEHGRRQ